jgi:hypothetical protein
MQDNIDIKDITYIYYNIIPYGINVPNFSTYASLQNGLERYPPI